MAYIIIKGGGNGAVIASLLGKASMPSLGSEVVYSKPVRICPFPSPMRATKESNDFTSGEIIGRLPYMRAVRDKTHAPNKNSFTIVITYEERTSHLNKYRLNAPSDYRKIRILRIKSAATTRGP
jgi:hypothetical protein